MGLCVAACEVIYTNTQVASINRDESRPSACSMVTRSSQVSDMSIYDEFVEVCILFGV